jgi:hypothetical protein
MKYRTERSGKNRRFVSTPTVRQEQLSEDRFHHLLNQAGAFFAEAERDVEAEKAAAISEIIQRMVEHGLSIDDLK